MKRLGIGKWPKWIRVRCSVFGEARTRASQGSLDQMAIFAVSWIFLSALLDGSLATRDQRNEHKVHNIVLFPEKHAWCNLTRIRQIVSHPGCESVEIDNSVCVGACFSYTVPQTSPPTPGDDLLHYCDSCQQADFEWRVVALECKEGKGTNKMLKHVQVINNCTCAKCQETPSITPEELSNAVEALEASKTPEFISSGVHRGKVPEDVREDLLRMHSDKIRGLNSQFMDYDDVDSAISAAAARLRHRSNAERLAHRVHQLHAVEGDSAEVDNDYDYDGSHRSDSTAAPLRKRLHPDDLPDAIQSALTGPDLHLTRGLEHAVVGDDDDSLSNDIKSDEDLDHYKVSTAGTTTGPPATTMNMATTTTASSFPNIRVPSSLPDFTSNAIDHGHDHLDILTKSNAVPSDDGP